MKVYIVTAGSYSDYHIERCFLNKEKAEAYMKVCNIGDLNDLEEYNLDDDIDISPVAYIKVQYWMVPSLSSGPDFQFDIVKTCMSDASSNLNRQFAGTDWFMFTRPIYTEKYDEEQLKKKYFKICTDIASQVESLTKVEGWDDGMIQEWFNTKINEVVPQHE